MKSSNEKCPICGTLNRNLNLEETEGWFECEKCKNEVKVLHERPAMVSVPLYELRELPKIFALKEGSKTTFN